VCTGQRALPELCPGIAPPAVTKSGIVRCGLVLPWRSARRSHHPLTGAEAGKLPQRPPSQQFVALSAASLQEGPWALLEAAFDQVALGCSLRKDATHN